MATRDFCQGYYSVAPRRGTEDEPCISRGHYKNSREWWVRGQQLYNSGLTLDHPQSTSGRGSGSTEGSHSVSLSPKSFPESSQFWKFSNGHGQKVVTVFKVLMSNINYVTKKFSRISKRPSRFWKFPTHIGSTLNLRAAKARTPMARTAITTNSIIIYKLDKVLDCCLHDWRYQSHHSTWSYNLATCV